MEHLRLVGMNQIVERLKDELDAGELAESQGDTGPLSLFTKERSEISQLRNETNEIREQVREIRAILDELWRHDATK